MDEYEEYDMINHYLEIGVLELSGLDENGDIVYRVTDLAETEAPELWEAHKDYVDEILVDLLEDGLISVEYNEDLEAIINMTPEGYELIRDMGLIEEENPEDD